MKKMTTGTINVQSLKDGKVFSRALLKVFNSQIPTDEEDEIVCRVLSRTNLINNNLDYELKLITKSD